LRGGGLGWLGDGAWHWGLCVDFSTRD
jgi:hypothetical protein